MTCAQSQQGMLVISNDNFLVGLLTGFCVANNFSFRSLPLANPLSINSVNRVCQVVLIDFRSQTSLAMAPHLDVLREINRQHGIPICAIYNQYDPDFPQSLPWVNYFNDADLISQLDRYLTQLIADEGNAYSERRNKERRSAMDRRGLPALTNQASNNHLFSLNHNVANVQKNFKLGPFDIDGNSRTVFCNGRDLALTAKEFKLFILLAEMHDQVCSTDRIIEKLWPNTRRANKSDLYQYMHLLRKKVEDDPDNPLWVMTVKGVGYRLNTSKQGV